MSGRGPAPKDPSKRARRNADVVPLRVVEIEPAFKPELPSLVDGESWSAPTLAWWRMLDFHPLKSEFTEMDWSYLLDTALLHNAYWRGDLKQASELRLREAKYGFTPEDRARLRIQFAQATDAEITTATKVNRSRDRFIGMRVDAELPGAVEVG
jgi:hypothetical protein